MPKTQSRCKFSAREVKTVRGYRARAGSHSGQGRAAREGAAARASPEQWRSRDGSSALVSCERGSLLAGGLAHLVQHGPLALGADALLLGALQAQREGGAGS